MKYKSIIAFALFFATCIHGTVLHYAISTGNSLYVEECCKSLQQENKLQEALAQYYKGCMPLHLAAKLGDFKSMEVLIKYGADINVRSKDGIVFGSCFSDLSYNALDYVIEKGCEGCVKLLCENGAQMNIHHDEIESPLMQSILAGKNDFVELFLENGADVDVGLKKRKYAPLTIAGATKNCEAIELLSSYGASIMIQCKSSWHNKWAESYCQCCTSSELISRKVHGLVGSRHGLETLLTCMAEKGLVKVVQALLYCALINERLDTDLVLNHQGYSGTAYQTVMKILQEAYVSPNEVCDKCGDWIKKYYGDLGVIAQMLQNGASALKAALAYKPVLAQKAFGKKLFFQFKNQRFTNLVFELK